MHSYGFGSTSQQYGTVPTGLQNVETLTSTQAFENPPGGGVLPTPGTSGEFGGEMTSPQSIGRKKKKKHKSGDNVPGSSVKPEVMDEENPVHTAVPMLAENQGVEDLLFNSSLSSTGGTVIGGQYLLNNSLLDQILTEKKLQLMQSPEVIECLQKHMSDK
ncbi:hypothetical protein SK128_027585 [Halocaridina rubra]|uniref:Uncharacterized protein n=1 Tax=Halocaridina rubra TaxID=373956 RepID=A0AAN8X5W7_HALRR